MKVVQRSPEIILKNGETTVLLRNHLNIYQVKQVAGDKLRLAYGGTLGLAPAGELIPLDRAAAYFTEGIKTKPREAFSYLQRALA